MTRIPKQKKPAATDDQIREALEQALGDVEAAAASLGMRPESVVRRIVASGLFRRLCEKLQSLRATLEAAQRECPQCGASIFVPVRCEFCGDVISAARPRQNQSQAGDAREHILRCRAHPLAWWTDTARALVTAWDTDTPRAVKDAVDEFRKRLVNLFLLPAEKIDSIGRRCHGPRIRKVDLGARPRPRSNTR